MAESAGGPSLDTPEHERLRKVFLNETFYKYQAILSRLEDPNLDKPLRFPLRRTDGTDLGTYEFRRFTHGEVTLLTRLPYFQKLAAKPAEPLTEAEQSGYELVKEELALRASTEPNRWQQLLEREPFQYRGVFSLLFTLSAMDEKFFEEMQSFFDSDLGYNYGLVWFSLFHLPPSLVAKLPESDYQAVMHWVAKWAERMAKR